MENIKIALLDDHPLVTDALKQRLEQEPDMQVTGVYADPCELLTRLDERKPDVLIMDISMPGMDGFQLAAELRERFGLTLKLIMLSGYTYEEFYLKAFRLGVNAYLSKQASYSQIMNAIRQSINGHMLVPEGLLAAYGADKLTPTEEEVLLRIAKERSNKEIAEELGISQRTVEYHLSAILQKLGAKTRVGAVVKGYEKGILGALNTPFPE